MDGVLNIRKPAGPTSHDIVARVRRLCGQKRVGHAGTLDPMATGVLLVCLGRATRIVEYLMGARKHYRATMVLGLRTDTQDSTGTELSRDDASSVTREAAEAAAMGFVGEIQQIPPMISAIKRNGRPLYDYARRGETVDREPRTVTVYDIALTAFRPGSSAEVELDVACSSGTYIRTLCADIGDRLGVGGHMSALERARVGRFSIQNALTMDDLANAQAGDRLDSVLISIDDALSDMPSAVMDHDSAAMAAHGLPARANTDAPAGGVVRMTGPDGLIGIGVVEPDSGATFVRPRKVLVEVG